MANAAAAADGRDGDIGAAAVNSPVAMFAIHVSLPLSTTASPGSPPAPPPLIGIGMLVSGLASVNVVPGIVVAVAVPGIVAPGIVPGIVVVVAGVAVPGIIVAGGVVVVDFWLLLPRDTQEKGKGKKQAHMVSSRAKMYVYASGIKSMAASLQATVN
uniref:Oleosin n=1 Tax=Leersia perrieri TaxID=77586 RepID=A0A0D9XHS7_9ORYZ